MVDFRINWTLQIGEVRKPRLLYTVLPFGRHCFQQCLCGAVGNRTYQGAKVSIYFYDSL